MSNDNNVCCVTADERDDINTKAQDLTQDLSVKLSNEDMDGDRVDAIITTAEKMLNLLLDINRGYKQGVEFNHEFIFKILMVQAENLLPDLRDLCDDLLFHEDDRYQKLSNLTIKLEEEGIEPLLPLVESFTKRSDNG